MPRWVRHQHVRLIAIAAVAALLTGCGSVGALPASPSPTIGSPETQPCPLRVNDHVLCGRYTSIAGQSPSGQAVDLVHLGLYPADGRMSLAVQPRAACHQFSLEADVHGSAWVPDLSTLTFSLVGCASSPPPSQDDTWINDLFTNPFSLDTPMLRVASGTRWVKWPPPPYMAD